VDLGHEFPRGSISLSRAANCPYTPAVVQKPRFNCDIRASFATGFRNWRVKSKLPLKKIAKDLGVSLATVSTWESGKCFPTACNFEMLANYTGMPPCKLFCIMADKCVPADCLLAMDRLKPKP
jgi:hypothetical protein